MRVVSIRLLYRCGLMVWFWSVAMPGLTASLSEQLADHGHPNTNSCVLPTPDIGTGPLLVVQFDAREDKKADRIESIAILKLMAEGLVSAGHSYIGFQPTESWLQCQDGDPRILYWRDYDGNWRLVDKKPVRFLARFDKALAPDVRDTPREAYVLHSLGMVEWRLERFRDAAESFEQAWEILAREGDPYDISADVLKPLFQYYLGKGRDEAKGQIYLDAYAQHAEALPGLDYLPVIKPAPAYPRGALNARLEGYVVLKFTVTRQGRVIDPVVIEQDPPGVFGDAAMEAALKFRYVPRMVDGQPVDVEGVRNVITFELR